MTTRYVRVHVGAFSETIAQRPGETHSDAIDRGVVLVLDTYDIEADDATGVWSEAVDAHEVARLHGVD